MCEVRRVFHNVNSDSKTALPLSSIKKPVVKFYDQLKSGKNEQETKESQLSSVFDENGSTKENSNEKKTQSIENDFSEPRLLTSLKIIESITSLGKEINKGKFTKPKLRACSGERKKKVVLFYIVNNLCVAYNVFIICKFTTKVLLLYPITYLSNSSFGIIIL